MRPSKPPRAPDDSTNLIDVTKLQEEFRAKKHSARSATLTVLGGPNLGGIAVLEKVETVLGRLEECDIVLAGEGVSRRHARIVRQENDEFEIEDLGSANGIIVNGEIRRRAILRDGDKIAIGSQILLRFSLQDTIDAEFQRALLNAATMDALTRAFNKAHFLKQLEVEVAFSRRHGTELCVLMFDIDFFKKINDQYGHPAGDAVLSSLGSIVLPLVRRDDVFGRYGGEEFAIACRNVTIEGATALGERVRSAIEAHRFEHDGRPIPVTISVGVSALSRAPSAHGAALIASADAALYEAKRGGRNRVVVARPPTAP
jgi:diguanylate cyclase (GGDEF)-like protein